MSDHAPDRIQDPHARSPAGLRLRLWLACLGGALVAAGGIWWVIGTQTGPGARVDLALVVSWLGAVAGLALIVGAALALWLDRGIVVHARGVTQALATQQVAQLRGLPAASGWGELSTLTQQVQQLLSRQRHMERATEELGLLRDQLSGLRESLERWSAEERWVELRLEGGPAAPAIDALNRGLRRWDEVREQNLDAARQVASEMERALATARESAEQSERGFVEATALLTTVRELQRLSQDLGQSVLGRTTTPLEAQAAVAAAARQAIEALIEGSTRSVDHLARSLRKVEEISDQVPLLANRATLIALNSTLGSAATMSSSELTEETRRLVKEIRTTVERSAALTRELETEVAAAGAQMRNVRERVSQQLEGLQQPSASPRAVEEVSRLLDRVREMIQDATRKGERLSATGERASRAAEGLTRALESDAREMAGLIARLGPTGPEQKMTKPVEDTPSRASGLRLLGPDELLGGEERRTPGAGEEPR
jgi:methyl-accepting chemotaxis protein